jgi:hypothetical protein
MFQLLESARELILRPGAKMVGNLEKKLPFYEKALRFLFWLPCAISLLIFVYAMLNKEFHFYYTEIDPMKNSIFALSVALNIAPWTLLCVIFLLKKKNESSNNFELFKMLLILSPFYAGFLFVFLFDEVRRSRSDFQASVALVAGTFFLSFLPIIVGSILRNIFLSITGSSKDKGYKE